MARKSNGDSQRLSRLDHSLNREISRVANKRKEFPKQIIGLLETRYAAEYKILNHVQYPHCEREDFSAHDNDQISSLNDTLKLLEKNKSLFSNNSASVNARLEDITHQRNTTIAVDTLMSKLSDPTIKIPSLPSIEQHSEVNTNSVVTTNKPDESKTPEDEIIGGSDLSLVSSAARINKQRTSTPIAHKSNKSRISSDGKSVSKPEDKTPTKPHEMRKSPSRLAKTNSKSTKSPSRQTQSPGRTVKSVTKPPKSPGRPTRSPSRAVSSPSRQGIPSSPSRIPTRTVSNRLSEIINDDVAFQPSNKVMHSPIETPHK